MSNVIPLKKQNPNYFINDKIHNLRLLNFLKANDFMLSIGGINEPIRLYKKDNNIIKEIKRSHLIEFIRKDINKYRNRNKILEAFLKVVNDYLSESKLIIGLSENKFDRKDLLELDRNIERYYFKNCFIEITKDEILKKNYSDIKKPIMYRDSMEKDFNKLYDIKSDDLRYFSFNKFIEFLTVLRKDYTDNTDALIRGDSKFHEERYNALMSIIGYLLSENKPQSLTKAILLTDIKLLENKDDANGGTGKSLLINALGFLVQVFKINGKTLKNNLNFIYSGLTREHNIILFDDVTNNFKVDTFYTDITSDMTVNHKGSIIETFKASESPKLVFTSNTPFNLKSSSDRRRFNIFEISDYFGENRTPVDVFDKEFFTTWNSKDWNKFYSLMFYAIQIYLRDGLIQTELININKNLLISQTNEMFIEFMDNYLQKQYRKDFISRMEFQELYFNYTNTPESKRDNSYRTKIGKWLGKYLKAKNLNLETKQIKGKRFIKIT